MGTTPFILTPKVNPSPGVSTEIFHWRRILRRNPVRLPLYGLQDGTSMWIKDWCAVQEGIKTGRSHFLSPQVGRHCRCQT